MLIQMKVRKKTGSINLRGDENNVRLLMSPLPMYSSGREKAMKSRDPYHQALTALAGFAGEGRFGPGMPLVITSLAGELGLSPTPVREALARLAGEGVIEHWPGRGYFAPGLAASDIVELYDYHQRLVLWAVDLPVIASNALPLPLADTWSRRLEQVFARAVSGAGNRVLAGAFRLAAARLRPVRAVEATIAPVPPSQVERLEGLLGEVAGDGLREAVSHYHQGRIEAAESIAAAMRRGVESID